MLDADGDGMISQEELMAALSEPLMMMEQQASMIMNAPDDELPPQAVAVVKYLKKVQDVIVPQVKDALGPKAEDGSLDKAAYCAAAKEFGSKLIQEEDFFAQSMALNPEMEAMPPQAKAIVEEAISTSKAAFMENCEELYGCSFDMFAPDGKMNSQQLNTSLTLLLPMTAEEKFNQIWQLVDTDSDGKITREEMTAFINRLIDTVIAIAHYAINIYKVIGEAIVIKVATACIEAKDANGLTYETVMEIAEEGPEYAMRVIAGGADN